MGKEKSGSFVTVNKGARFGGLYLLTYIGTLIYFLNNAEGAAEVLLSFFQALVWPALLIYRVFQLLNI